VQLLSESTLGGKLGQSTPIFWLVRTSATAALYPGGRLVSRSTDALYLPVLHHPDEVPGSN
jgi:hypothetical protein